jgi:hypothetical protein
VVLSLPSTILVLATISTSFPAWLCVQSSTIAN